MNFRSVDDIVVGNTVQVPISDGSKVKYVNLDNAATTPPFKKVLEKVNDFSQFYSSVHRGSGFKSTLSTEIFEQCRQVVLDFVGADKEKNTAIFVHNSTEALNTLASSFNFQDDDIVICSRMEHHSNDLPWRLKAKVHYIEVDMKGELELSHLETLLKQHGNKVKLVTVTGASNVTGYINPIHKIAKIAHSVGAKVLIDASQLVPHRKINLKQDNDEEHLDFVVFTGHKIYAPFGSGVIIGSKDFFNTTNPHTVGGGTVKIVTDDEIYWDVAPEKNEAGTPNLIGIVALASAINEINKISMSEIENHEQILLEYFLKRIKTVGNIKIYGCIEADSNKRLGVVSFNIGSMPHSLISAILSYEYGIGVRSGCFCAHPYVIRLLNLSSEEIDSHKLSILNNDKTNLPGLIRVSFGVYNTFEDIDRLILALKNISEGKIKNKYILDKNQGIYSSEEVCFNTGNLFKL